MYFFDCLIIVSAIVVSVVAAALLYDARSIERDAKREYTPVHTDMSYYRSSSEPIDDERDFLLAEVLGKLIAEEESAATEA